MSLSSELLSYAMESSTALQIICLQAFKNVLCVTNYTSLSLHLQLLISLLSAHWLNIVSIKMTW